MSGKIVALRTGWAALIVCVFAASLVGLACGDGNDAKHPSGMSPPYGMMSPGMQHWMQGMYGSGSYSAMADWMDQIHGKGSFD
jgi:hypothetical protein